MRGQGLAPAQDADVVVVGGGLTGLATAIYLAREGREVVLLEQGHALGGRASTQNHDGFLFNRGPHTVLARHHAASVLAELGVRWSGGRGLSGGLRALRGDSLHLLPAGLFSALSTRLLSLGAKLELASFMTRVTGTDAEDLHRTSTADWLRTAVRSPELRRLAEAFIRLTTYSADLEALSAAVAVEQVVRTFEAGAYCLDGGWQTVVHQLQTRARGAGVHIHLGARAKAVEHDGRVQGVWTNDGAHYRASSIVLCTPPDVASALVDDGCHPALRRWAIDTRAVRIASLSLGLNRIRDTYVDTVLGIDSPVSLVVHSGMASLAPEGRAVVQAVKYLDDVSEQPDADRRELESVVEAVVPGWRDALGHVEFQPSLTVSHAMVTARSGGRRSRPGPDVPAVRGLYVAGDWVGPEGLLTDASLWSARAAAECVLRHQAGASQWAA